MQTIHMTSYSAITTVPSIDLALGVPVYTLIITCITNKVVVCHLDRSLYVSCLSNVLIGVSPSATGILFSSWLNESKSVRRCNNLSKVRVYSLLQLKYLFHHFVLVFHQHLPHILSLFKTKRTKILFRFVGKMFREKGEAS